MIASTLSTLTLAASKAASHGAADAAHDAVSHAASSAKLGSVDGSWGPFLLVPLFPLLGAILCGIYRALGIRNKLPAWTTIALLACSFFVVLAGYGNVVAGDHANTLVTYGFDWINISWGDGLGQSIVANFSLWTDSLTILWMLFVTGLATVIALYASEYMAGDVEKGHYPRFFAAFCLFVFAMSCLVMGDNMLLLFLGWEGVGLCSYLLIGYFYEKPSAVAAAKKAFILNRVGDFGLLVAMMLTFVHFGSLEFSHIFAQVDAMKAAGDVAFGVKLIPFMLAVGAFGKSAQLPLYVWLPDAMEGPTPVSALIHAATMVTAGVYLIARFLPIFALEPSALAMVAWVGGLTAFFAATIGMAVYDIKRVMAYSTVSQLGYMFLGLGLLTSHGAAYHVYTHAFFKAALFLSCGAVMHGFAGQLDLRRLSGVRKMKGWKVTSITMLVGCLCLAGFPGTSGFFSKDMIIAEAFVTPGPGYKFLGFLALLTAGMTAYYCFRAYFRVFEGPVEYHPGDEHHASENDAPGNSDHGDDDHAHSNGHFHPHAPGLAINIALGVLVVGIVVQSLLAIFNVQTDWVGSMVSQSTADAHVAAGAFDAPVVDTHAVAAADHGAATSHDTHAVHGSFFGMDPHGGIMYVVSGIVGAIGIFLAWWLHLAGRKEAATSRADALKNALGPIGVAAENKWYVDEIYDVLFRYPLRLLAYVFWACDGIIDAVVNLFGWSPHGTGESLRPLQSGRLQGYATGMAFGVGLLLILAGYVWLS